MECPCRSRCPPRSAVSHGHGGYLPVQTATGKMWSGVHPHCVLTPNLAEAQAITKFQRNLCQAENNIMYVFWKAEVVKGNCVKGGSKPHCLPKVSVLQV